MKTKISEQIRPLLSPFKAALGEHFDKVVRDMSSFVGNQSFTTDEGRLKAGSKLSISTKDNHKMSLPPNNPLSHLFWFAIRLDEVAEASGMEIQASLPKAYKDAFAQLQVRAEVSSETVKVS